MATDRTRIPTTAPDGTPGATADATPDATPKPPDLEMNPSGDDDTGARRITPLKVLLGLVVLGIIGMWAYAYSPLARVPAPDALKDLSMGPRGEAICQRAADALTALPPASDTDQPGERAEVVRRSNQILASMVDQLAALPIASDRGPAALEKDQRIYNEWITDWRTYLGNRDDYVNRLRTDPSARIFVTQKGQKQVTEPIGGFAKSNGMPSCAPPGDIF